MFFHLWYNHYAAEEFSELGMTTSKRIRNHLKLTVSQYRASFSYIVNNWILSTNHRRIAIMYFFFIVITAFSGLTLATIIRIELAIPGVSFLGNNSERYLTIISMHAVVMVFFVIIPLLFGAFGNFLLPTQLGVRDVAFPRLNSFMFWVTPSGFVLLLHIILFDKDPATIFNMSNETCKGGLTSSTKFKTASTSTTMNSDLGAGYSSGGFSGERLLSVKNPLAYTSIRLNSTKAHLSSKDIVNLLSSVEGRSSTAAFDATAALRLNLAPVRSVIVKVSSWVSNQLIAGWAFITPYSSRLRFTAVGKVDIALIVVFMAGLGSVFSAVNYVITYRCVSSATFKNRKELRSFFADSLLVGSRMMLAANPALLIAILFLLSDRHLGTSIFDFSGGGDAVLFQHLFWFFGHPEVYIIIIPCFGIINSLLPHFLRKRLSGRLSLQFSMYTIAFMGFAVWGHHMYMVGLANTTRTLYSTMTVMISVPASTKILHWCVTIINSAPQLDVSFLFLLAFVYFFTLGGLSGMFNAHIGFDVCLHDTFYVIGHFHVMLAGAAFSCAFAAFYFYFGSIFGVKHSKVFGYLHFFFYFFGQLFTLIPMFWLGYSGMPRRIMDYPAYFGGWHSVISGGHLLSVMSYIFFICMLVESFYDETAPTTLTHGVPRLNTRFAFYLYERSKLSKNSRVINTSTSMHGCPQSCVLLESTNISYIFR